MGNHAWQYGSDVVPNYINLPKLLQWQFGIQLPNLIPANTSGYTVVHAHYEVLTWACTWRYTVVTQFYHSLWAEATNDTLTSSYTARTPVGSCHMSLNMQFHMSGILSH